MRFWKDKRVLVTGSTGFIGSHLVKRLLLDGATVTEFVHVTPSKWYDTYKVKGDLLGDIPEFGKQDIVFHLAAQPIVEIAADSCYNTLDVNIRGTYNLLERLKSMNIKCLVHISTDKVYGNTPNIDHKSELRGTEHPYNVSKLCGDNLASMYAKFCDIPTAIVRNANIYGEGDLHFERIIPRTIKKIVSGESPVIRGDGSNLRDYIYVEDIVRGYLKAAEFVCEVAIVNPSEFIFGANEPTSVFNVVHRIISMINPFVQPINEEQMKGEIPNQHIDNTKVNSALHWHPTTSFSDGLEKTVRWYENYLTG